MFRSSIDRVSGLRLTGSLLLVLTVACTNGGERPEAIRTPSAESSVEASAEVATRLLYLDGRSLTSFDLGTGASKLIDELPSADAALSPDGRAVVVVRESHPAGEGPEGFRAPVLMMVNTSDPGSASELGPGRAPTWSADGTEVAAIAPSENGETIVVYGVPGGPRATAAPRDESWSMVGWSGNDIVAIGSVSGVVEIPRDGSEVITTPFEPAEYWGVSPVNDTRMTVSRDGFELTHSSGSIFTTNGRGAPGDGTWSWDGSRIGVVMIGGGRPFQTRPLQTRLVLIDTDDREIVEVPAGARAQGNVVWAEDGDTFAFVRTKEDQRGRLEAVICRGAVAPDCDALFSWDEGVTLLGFTSA